MMPENNDKFWTAERVEFLREWRARGARTIDIAASLGTTKSAIAGKCARLNIPCDGRASPVPPAFTPMPRVADIPMLPGEVEIDAWPEFFSRDCVRRVPTSLFDRKFDQCASVLDRTAQGAAMCGKPTIFGPMRRSSWCAEHYDLYHRKEDNGQTG
jgi:GcrA cell cycle regulator